MRIFLVGGGTGGPTTPLLAVAQALQKMRPDAELFFVGNKKVLEQRLIEASGLTVTYLTIPAGKWRRYFSARNIIDLFKFVAGVIKSIYFLQKYHPDIIFGAGSFVQVPMVLAAFFFKTPSVIHQQDFELLLSTKLAAPFAKAVTVSFGYSGKEIPQSSGLFAKIPRSKIYITGNPVRRDIVSGSAGKARQI